MSLFSGLGLVPDSILALKPGCPLGILLGARQMVVLWALFKDPRKVLSCHLDLGADPTQ